MNRQKIKDRIKFCEKQSLLARKKGNMDDFLYWDRKTTAGHFLLITYPMFTISLGLATIALIVAIIGVFT